MNNNAAASKQFNKAEHLSPAIDEDFVIYRSKRNMQEDLLEQSQGGAVGMDMVSMISYNNNFRQCKKKFERAAHLHMEFWAKLNCQAPDVGRLTKIGAKINIVISEIEDFWNQMQKINPNMPHALRLYAHFLKEILNDPEGAHELLKAIKDSTTKKGQEYLQDEETNEDECLISTYASDGTPCVCISGETNTLGKIQVVNKSFLRLFGYSEAKMADANIGIIIPEIIQIHHDKFLRHAVENPDEVKSLRKEMWVPAMHSNGYFLMVHVILRELPSFTNKMNFVATLKPDRISETKSYCYLLLNPELRIVGVSESN